MSVRSADEELPHAILRRAGEIGELRSLRGPAWNRDVAAGHEPLRTRRPRVYEQQRVDLAVSSKVLRDRDDRDSSGVG